MPLPVKKKAVAKALPAKKAAPRQDPDDILDEDEERPRPAKKMAATKAAAQRKYSDDDDDDDDDDRPARKQRKGGGWAQADKAAKESSSFPDRLKPEEAPDSTSLIKFMEDEPFHSYNQHWLNGRKGQKSFVCLGDSGKGCPLCDIGQQVSTRVAFNVAELDQTENTWSLKTFEVFNTLAAIIRGYHEDKRLGPLTQHYYTVKLITRGKSKRYQIDIVRTRDLVDEWGVEPIPEDRLAKLSAKLKGPDDIVTVLKYSALKEIAAEMASEDDDDEDDE